MIGQKNIILSFSHDIMKQTQLFMQVIVKSVVAARAADMNRLRVIPDVTTLTLAAISLMRVSSSGSDISPVCRTKINSQT